MAKRAAPRRSGARKTLPPGTKMTSLLLPPGLRAQLGAAAARRGLSLGQLVRTACDEWLRTQPEATRGRPPQDPDDVEEDRIERTLERVLAEKLAAQKQARPRGGRT